MIKHTYDKDDISDLKEAKKLLRTVQEKIENDIEQYNKLEELQFAIEDIIEDAT